MAAARTLEHLTIENASLAEIRRRAIDAYKMGKGSQADIASSYRVDLRTFQRGLSRFNETGQTAPRPRGHRQALYSGKQLKALAQLGGKHPGHHGQSSRPSQSQGH
ncbi:MAG: helix-turn-helix domain-containing protein [Kiritimatiellae bacterium]|nr:helix-turn-helix domain-containing protein [Kiritimatiellia bacterium]